nr:hypothetical protein CFP56_08027 [Quercus suber]
MEMACPPALPPQPYCTARVLCKGLMETDKACWFVELANANSVPLGHANNHGSLSSDRPRTLGKRHTCSWIPHKAVAILRSGRVQSGRAVSQSTMDGGLGAQSQVLPPPGVIATSFLLLVNGLATTDNRRSTFELQHPKQFMSHERSTWKVVDRQLEAFYPCTVCGKITHKTVYLSRRGRFHRTADWIQLSNRWELPARSILAGDAMYRRDGFPTVPIAAYVTTVHSVM